MKWIQEETKFERGALSSIYLSAIIIFFTLQINGVADLLNFFLIAFVKIMLENIDWFSPWYLIFLAVLALVILVKRTIIDFLGMGADGDFAKGWMKWVMLGLVLGQIAYYTNQLFCTLGPMPNSVPGFIIELLDGTKASDISNNALDIIACRSTKIYMGAQVWKLVIPALWNLGPLIFLIYSKKRPASA
jgi:hypothetical protein